MLLFPILRGRTAQSSLWPSDEELLERFIDAPLYWYLTRGRMRMILEGIEEALRTNKAESREVPGNLQIEHVMPANVASTLAAPRRSSRR